MCGSEHDIKTDIWSSMAWTMLILQTSPLVFVGIFLLALGKVIWNFGVVTNRCPC